MLTRRHVLRWTVGTTAALLANPKLIVQGSLSDVGYAAEPSPMLPDTNLERDLSPIPTKPKTIVICSDGTGNIFESETNVSHIVKCLSLEDTDNQVVVYDQGLGTAEKQSKAFQEYRESLGKPKHRLIQVVADSDQSLEFPLRHTLGLAVGLGLKENVKQLYVTLATLYEEGDLVFLFGFSRGAFTVRALAGLLYRCRLVPKEANPAACFDRAWQLYEPLEQPKEAIEFRNTQRACPIHFMGLWDTVKSYGIIHPVMLPHLRHNPIVKHVRHALALHEHRAFFHHTTWGLLDSDDEGAMKRLRESMSAEDLALLKQQRNNIKEVWFEGCHSDIGGGNGYQNATLSLRWMLGEAADVEGVGHPGSIRLNDNGRRTLASLDPDPTPKPNESYTATYETLEKTIPRWEIDNSGENPTRKGPIIGATGTRDPDQSQRDGGKVFFHETVRLVPPIKGKVETCYTNRLAAAVGQV